ncbi:MAG: CoA transferase [Actinobacteria bacterium]|nr:CoA transferase [Actinomycetota bacterium]
MSGPLTGFRVIEIAGIGPGPFAAMLLADMGAEVIRVERSSAVRGPAPDTPHYDVLLRGRRNLAIDLKNPDGIATLLDLVESADAILEGFRPGVMERLGIGPEECMERNPKLVYGRMTGWGQEGPYSLAAGHDINYISLSGALAHFGRAGEKPVPPLNMVGDFGGGGMFLAFGVVCALLEAQRSGQGQVQMDSSEWPALKDRLTELFAQKTRAEWCEIMEMTDVCFAPVLTMSEAAEHPHNVERETFIELGGMQQPAPAPRFSRTSPEVSGLPAHPGQHTREILADWGIKDERVATLLAAGAVRQAE